MANNIIERIWNQNAVGTIEDLSGSVFQAEAGAHTFVISGVDNAGAEVALSGTVAGVFMKPDNTDVPLTGSISNGKASVTLTAECYTVPGRFGLTIFVTSGSVKTAVYAAVGTVSRTNTGNVSASAEADVVDLINRINAAVATVPASWSGLMADLAPTYSPSAVYPAGAYVYYNGDLYRSTTAITSAESWTAAHWTTAVLGNDVSDLKSALEKLESYRTLNIFEPGGIVATTGNNVNTHAGIRTGYISNDCVRLKALDGYWFNIYLYSKTDGSYIGCLQSNGTIGKTSSTLFVTEYDLTGITDNCRVYLKRTSGADVTVSEYTNLLFGFYTDKTLSEENIPADAKVTGEAISDIHDFLDDELLKTVAIPGAFVSVLDKCALVNCANLDKVFITNKNLLPVWTATTTNNGIERSYNSDGSLNFSGTSTDVATFTFTATNMPPISNGDFTLSIKNNSVFGNTDEDGYLQLEINSNYSTAHVCRFNRMNDYLSFHLSESEIVTGYRIRIASGVSIPSGFKFYPQIEVGVTETDFVKNETKSFTPTTADTDDVSCFVGENYICAKGTMTGNVEYVIDTQHEIEGAKKYVSNLTGKTVVCFGDSITGNYPFPNDYPAMLAELTGATVYNVGFGGCCMADNHLVDTSQTRYLFTMCRLADSIVAGDFSAQRNSGVSITYKQGNATINYVPERIATLESIDWTKVDYITIAYGTNDWNSNYPLDNENNPLDTTTYIGAFRYSVEKLLTAYPNLKILPITPLWRFWDSDTGMPSGQTGDYLDANTYAKGTGYYLWNYGDALIEASKEYHIPVLDMYHNCMMNKFNRHQYFNITDGTHPKYEGRKLFAEILSGALESKY